MYESLVISEILFAVIYGIAALVLREFIRSKDGQLRKIMIWYFSVEIFVYLGSAVYFGLVAAQVPIMGIDTFRVIIVLPKVAVKIWLLVWLKGHRKTTGLHEH